MLRSLKNGLVDLVFPKTCTICKTTIKAKPSIEEAVCLPCWGKIKKNTPPFCHSCGRPLEKNNLNKGLCAGCIKKRLHFDRALSPCAYDGIMKELIHEFKYKNREHLGKPLSKLMVEFIKEYDLPVKYMDAIVPMPLHRSKMREREFNQAHVLSQCLASELGKPVLDKVLIRSRSTKAQAELQGDARLLNVKGAFEVNEPESVRGKNLLLVDDVLTTGATSSEASLTLKGAGANIVFVLSLAN